MSKSSLSLIPYVSRLSPLVSRILGCNPGPMTLQGTNTYVVGNGKRRLLIDTGDGDQPDYFANLKQFLKDEDVTVSTVLLTHWHHDHVGGVEEILRDIAEKDSSVFKYRRSDQDEATTAYSYIEDGFTFAVEGATLKAVHTPGHTTDHVVVHLQEENAVFSGDCILGEGTAVFEDLHDYMASLKRLLEMKPGIIYPGHGAVVKEPVAKIEDYISHRLLREEQIYQVLASSRDLSLTAMDIVKKVYTDTPEELHRAAAYNVSHHLSKLQKDKRIMQSEVMDGENAYKICQQPSL